MTSLIEIVDEKKLTVQEKHNSLTGERWVEIAYDDQNPDTQATGAGIVAETLLFLFHSGAVANEIFQRLGIALTKQEK